VLNTTGSVGGLTVTGDGNASLGGNNSGGTIQNSTGHGISLTNTRDVSLTNLNIQTTGGHGINGVGVTNFTFSNGKINNAGDASGENSINFDPDSGTPNVTNSTAVTGVVSITNSQITNTEADGIRIVNYGGTLSNVVISGNTLTDTGDVATPGSAILILARAAAVGSAASITKATLSDNTITTFRAGAGFVIQATSDATGSAFVNLGTPGSATDVINVTGNLMDGGGLGIGNQPDRFITAGIAGTAAANFNVSNNGTAASPIRNIDGVVIELQVDGHSTYTATVNNNFIAANNAVGSAGIAIGADADAFAGTTDDAFMTATVSGNNISLTDGPGIFALARGTSTARLDAHILNNTVAAPSTTNAARAGIRVDSGSASSIDTTVNLEISGNTTAGSTNTATGTTSPGINLRKQGTDPNVNEFHIKGMPDPAPLGEASPNVENYVNSLNTSTSGTFGVGGTALLSATSGFRGDTPVGFLQAAPGGVEASGGGTPGGVLTGKVVATLADAAGARWAATGLSVDQLAALEGITITVTDLAGDNLGTFVGNQIVVDSDAAGRGWFIDDTPLDDLEFGNVLAATRLQTDPTEAPAGHFDLLTVIMHEMGHGLGLDDLFATDVGDELMSGELVTGERRLPGDGEADGAVIGSIGQEAVNGVNGGNVAGDVFLGEGDDLANIQDGSGSTVIADFVAGGADDQIDLSEFSFSDLGDLAAHTSGNGNDHAADRGLAHMPTELPPVDPPPTPPEVSQPPGLDHMSSNGLEHNHIPDWFVV
jgi:hypothetical protein